MSSCVALRVPRRGRASNKKYDKLKYSVSMYDIANNKWCVPMKFTSLLMIYRFYGNDFELTKKDIERIYKHGDNFWKIEKIS